MEKILRIILGNETCQQYDNNKHLQELTMAQIYKIIQKQEKKLITNYILNTNNRIEISVKSIKKHKCMTIIADSSKMEI